MIRQTAPLLLATGLTAIWIGCQSATESDVTEQTAGSSQSATSDLSLVTLKVPNMT